MHAGRFSSCRSTATLAVALSVFLAGSPCFAASAVGVEGQAQAMPAVPDTGMDAHWPPSSSEISRITRRLDGAAALPIEGEAEGRHFLRIAQRQEEQAGFLNGLKRLGLVYKRVCVLDRNTVLDLSRHQIEFLAADGRYARLRVSYHAPYRMDYAPALTITGDPSKEDIELKTASIEEFMRRTQGLTLIEAKITELTKTVGPPMKAEDEKGGCSGEGWAPVPIEVR